LAGEYPHLAPRLRPITHYDGTFIDARGIAGAILVQEKIKEAAHV